MFFGELTCSSVADDDLLGLRMRLAVGVPDGQVGLHQLREEVDVPDGEPQRVHLGEPLLVGQGGDVSAEPLERVVDGLHAAPLPHVGRLPQVLHLVVRPHPPPALQRRPAVVPHPRGQLRGAVRAAVGEGGGGGGEGQVAHVVVSIRSAVFAVVVLEMTREEVHVLIQKVIRVQVSVSRGLVREKLVIVEVRRGGERVESREGVQHAVHLCPLQQ